MADLSSIGRSRKTFKKSTNLLATKVDQVIKDLKTNLEERGKNASRELTQSIRVETKAFGVNLNIKLIMADYWEAVDKGRKAGKAPPPDAMLRWVRTKESFRRSAGLTGSSKNVKSREKSLAYLVGQKIAREGTKASNFYSDVINPKSLGQLQSDLGNAYRQDIVLQFQTLTETLNNQ